MARLNEKFERLARGEGRRTHSVFAREEATFLHIPVEEISPDPDQPRQDLGDLEGLKDSIRRHGILQPLVVSPVDSAGYRLITGERRYTAARDLGLETVPALVRTVQEHQRLEVQLVENLLRKDLDPLEEARSYRRLMDEYGLTQEAVGQKVGKSVASINEMLRLLDLSPGIQDALRTSETDTRTVSKSVLLEIAKQPTEAAQEQMWEEARKGNLTVKKARTVKNAVAPTLPPPTPVKTAHVVLPATEQEPRQRTIATPEATVTVSFTHGAATVDAVRAALQYALAALDTQSTPH